MPEKAKSMKASYHQGIDAGNAIDMCELAASFHHGADGVPKNAPAAKSLYQQAIDAGNVEAMLGLAALFHYGGDGVPKDAPAAKALYQRAIDAGNVEAMYWQAALFHSGGDGVPKDAPAAMALYQRAIDVGNVDAMYGLAALFHSGGNGVPKDAQAAKVLYQQAIDAGNGNATYGLAALFHHGGDGVPKDAPAAKVLYEQAINAGNIEALLGLAALFHYGDNGVPKHAVAAKYLYQRAIDAGNVEAMYGLAALFHYGGNRVPKNAAAAKDLYQQAIDAGNVCSMYRLGTLLHYGGDGVPKDAPAARALYQRGIDAGNVEAIYGLAALFHSGGDSVPKNAPAAKALYQRAIDFGNVEAIYGLADLLHYGGDHVPKDAPAAKDLYQQAICAGNINATRGLASLLKRGGDGVPKDAPAAKALYQQAIDAGNVEAMLGLADLFHYGGDGVPKDAPAAKALYHRAIDAGNVNAMLGLAALFHYGGNGVPKDAAVAKALYQRAIDAGNVDAIRGLAEISQSIVCTPSELELVYGAALSDLSILDEQFLLKHIRADNVKVASDLYLGHNIVLLAIRTDVITRSNIRALGGSSWYLQDNLYFPGSKIVTENGSLIDAVFQHAESLGIIKCGYALKVGRDIRTDFTKQTEKIGKTIEIIAERVQIVERRASSLEGSVETLWSDLKKMSLAQRNQAYAIQSLADSLTQLRKLMRKQDKRMTYCAVARCMLSFIPLVGSAVGNAAYTATEVLLNLNVQDIVSAGIDVTKGVATSMVQVDISNYQVARYAFSKECIDSLNKPARDAITKAVSASEFKSMNQLHLELVKQTFASWSENIPTAFLDMGSDLRLHDKRPSSSNEGSVLEDKARKYFQSLTITNEHDALSIEDAKSEMNRFLSRCPGYLQVSNVKLEDLFFEITDDSEDFVSEASFAEILRKVIEEQGKEKRKERILAFCTDYFAERLGSNASLSIRMAARVLVNVFKELKNEGMVDNSRMEMTTLQAKEELKKRDIDGSSTIDLAEFTKTALEFLLA